MNLFDSFDVNNPLCVLCSCSCFCDKTEDKRPIFICNNCDLKFLKLKTYIIAYGKTFSIFQPSNNIRIFDIEFDKVKSNSIIIPSFNLVGLTIRSLYNKLLTYTTFS